MKPSASARRQVKRDSINVALHGFDHKRQWEGPPVHSQEYVTALVLKRLAAKGIKVGPGVDLRSK
jgi:hypothetical protein